MSIRVALLAAEDAERPAERYVAAYRVALLIAASVLSARRVQIRGRLGVWRVLARVAPELAEWADYFAALQLKHQAVEAGASGIVSSREADDLIRDAYAFARAAEAHPGSFARAPSRRSS